MFQQPTSYQAPGETLPGPYWEPQIDPPPREKAFLGRVLCDFAYAWRHVLRRPMNSTTFIKFAYATLWFSRGWFGLHERTGFDYITKGGQYIWVVDLPRWETPAETLVKVGSSWFVLAQGISEGLEMIRHHRENTASVEAPQSSPVSYVILTLRQVVLCKMTEHGLIWTKPETLFGDAPATPTSIGMLLWVVTKARPLHLPSTLDCLPVEVQDRILYYATTSLVASAKLGCELGLGTAFHWIENGREITVQKTKTHRSERSPVESQILLSGVMSGLSYKRG